MKRIDKSLIYFTLLTETCARLFHYRPRVRLFLSKSNRDVLSNLNSLRLCTRQNIIQTVLLSVAVSHSWPLYRFNISSVLGHGFLVAYKQTLKHALNYKPTIIKSSRHIYSPIPLSILLKVTMP